MHADACRSAQACQRRIQPLWRNLDCRAQWLREELYAKLLHHPAEIKQFLRARALFRDLLGSLFICSPVRRDAAHAHAILINPGRIPLAQAPFDCLQVTPYMLHSFIRFSQVTDKAAINQMLKLLTDVIHRWQQDRKSTRLNSSHVSISYAVFCLKKKQY